MGDAESANEGESIVLTTNGSPWERAVELKKISLTLPRSNQSIFMI